MTLFQHHLFIPILDPSAAEQSFSSAHTTVSISGKDFHSHV